MSEVTQSEPTPEDMPPPDVEASDEVQVDASSGALEGDVERLKRVAESLLFASDKPLTAAQIKAIAKVKSVDAINKALKELEEEYHDRGFVLHSVAGGYQFRTHPSCSDWVQKLVQGRPVRLSRAQLETLSIVAYRQPVTKPDIDDIRGVDSSATVKLLLDRNVIRILGKKEEPGRPLLYGTTKDFLALFNLNGLRELPSLREFHELTEESKQRAEQLGVDLSEPVAAAPDAVDAGSAEVPEGEAVAASEGADGVSPEDLAAGDDSGLADDVSPEDLAAGEDAGLTDENMDGELESAGHDQPEAVVAAAEPESAQAQDASAAQAPVVEAAPLQDGGAAEEVLASEPEALEPEPEALERQDREHADHDDDTPSERDDVA